MITQDTNLETKQDSTHNETTKIIYIMGCGRSGTTILSIVLGNNEGMLNIGEVGDYPKFYGRPNAYDESTPNFQFWNKVYEKFSQENGKPDFDELSRLCETMEYHKGFLANFFNLVSKETVSEYKKYISGLYRSIFAISDVPVIVDSSKFPNRALSLLKYFDQDVYIIHFVRDPIGVIDALKKSEEKNQGARKSFLSANMYYFVINFFCNMLQFRISKDRFIRVKYEDFISDPLAVVQKIQLKFNLNLNHSRELIEKDSALETGYMFNGNRMRLHKEIKLMKKTVYYKMTFRNFMTRFLNGIWH